jgi:hypothetical protein
MRSVYPSSFIAANDIIQVIIAKQLNSNLVSGNVMDGIRWDTHKTVAARRINITLLHHPT